MTVDLDPRPLDIGRLPLRRRVAVEQVPRLVATDPALRPLRAAEVSCDVDVTVARPDGGPGWATLQCRHGLLGDRVASTAWAGGDVEVAAYAVEHWQAELSRVVTVPVPPAAPPPPDDRFEVPLDVLLGAGEAMRTNRPDILDELVRRAASDDPARLRERLVRLNLALVGRLVATVAHRSGGTSRVGWVSWLLFGDGWRSLTPSRCDGQPAVEVERVTPLDLGVHVAALATRVRGRS